MGGATGGESPAFSVPLPLGLSYNSALTTDNSLSSVDDLSGMGTAEHGILSSKHTATSGDSRHNAVAHTSACSFSWTIFQLGILHGAWGVVAVGTATERYLVVDRTTIINPVLPPARPRNVLVVLSCSAHRVHSINLTAATPQGPAARCVPRTRAHRLPRPTGLFHTGASFDQPCRFDLCVVLFEDAPRAANKAGNAVDGHSFIEEIHCSRMSESEGADAGVACALTDTSNPPSESARSIR